MAESALRLSCPPLLPVPSSQDDVWFHSKISRIAHWDSTVHEPMKTGSAVTPPLPLHLPEQSLNKSAQWRAKLSQVFKPSAHPSPYQMCDCRKFTRPFRALIFSLTY